MFVLVPSGPSGCWWTKSWLQWECQHSNGIGYPPRHAGWCHQSCSLSDPHAAWTIISLMPKPVKCLRWQMCSRDTSDGSLVTPHQQILISWLADGNCLHRHYAQYIFFFVFFQSRASVTVLSHYHRCAKESVELRWREAWRDVTCCNWNERKYFCKSCPE